MHQIDRLKTDCSKCAALCCVVLAFDKGKDFAFDKNPGEPCRNLSGHRCTIHNTLAQDGFPGCVAYDCLGAGNRVVQEVFAGQSWQRDPRLMPLMMEAFSAMREVHKRIDMLRAAEFLTLEPRIEQKRKDFLDDLERHHWSGPELNEFEFGLALEIDIFFHGSSERSALPVPLDGEVAT
ncbi:hypothetical protein [Pseudoruegeria sp. SK021]|uniref:hypothetical protein n=1 Tax=Pseudoruegeria sp. SK021 TaxID=1933035 RepID=UPI000A246FBD|nr:hypothetical protein [Pseudoruegeria sp. SK021]OSP56248.1 hypothetical protein BV911_02860 [Pseudoruegeria sp. SK021]